MGLATGHGRRRDLTGWNLAVGFGLLAAAFLVERLAPAGNENVRKTKQDAPALRPAGGGDRGRHAASPSEIRAKGWKDISGARVLQHRGPSNPRPRRRHDVLQHARYLSRVGGPGCYLRPVFGPGQHRKASRRCIRTSSRAVRSTSRASSSHVSRRRETGPLV